jgi:hypothetical protein
MTRLDGPSSGEGNGQALRRRFAGLTPVRSGYL